MTRMTRAVAVLVAVLAWPVGAAPQQPGVAVVDEPAIAKEVNAFMDLYWQLWSAGQIDQLVARIYHPFGQLSNQGHSSIDQLTAGFPKTRQALLAGGYGRSQMPVRNVCVLSPTVAIVSGRGFRYLADGKVMGEFGWTYTLLKGTAGWKMVSIYSHEPTKALVCGGERLPAASGPR